MRDCIKEESSEIMGKQVCPICNKITSVGKLSGGKRPHFYCSSCLREFIVYKDKQNSLLAKVQMTTVSGIKAGTVIFKYNEPLREFYPVD